MTAVYAWYPGRYGYKDAFRMGNYSLLDMSAQISLLNFSIAARIHCLLACISTIRMERPIRGQSRDRPEIQRRRGRGPSPSGAASICCISSCEFRSRPDQQVLRVVRRFGNIFLAGCARSRDSPFEFRELFRQLDEIGSMSLPLVALAGAATGVVLSMEARYSLTRFGAKSLLPAAIVFSVLHETGPIITGLVVSGRVGAGIGAELASMKVTEQIDAVETCAVSPYRSWRRPAFWLASSCCLF